MVDSTSDGHSVQRLICLVEHREVAPTQSDSSSTHTADLRSPPLPPRARPLPSPRPQSPKPLGDKNPFRPALKLDSNNPFAQKPADTLAYDLMAEDEELQRAFALSQEPSMDVDHADTEAEEEERDRAARKVRTSGPPPSPTLSASEGVQWAPMIGPVQQPSPYSHNTSDTKMIDWQQVRAPLSSRISQPNDVAIYNRSRFCFPWAFERGRGVGQSDRGFTHDCQFPLCSVSTARREYASRTKGAYEVSTSPHKLLCNPR